MSLLESQSSPIGVAHGASRSAWAMVVLSLVFLAIPVPAAAQNLLDNPNLDSNMNGWDHSGNTTFDSSEGSPNPGSARLEAEMSGEKDGIILIQCIDGIVAGAEYLLRRPSPEYNPAEWRVHRHCDWLEQRLELRRRWRARNCRRWDGRVNRAVSRPSATRRSPRLVLLLP